MNLPTIQTLGGALSGMIVEAVVDPRDSNHLRLHTWDGRRATTTTRLECNGTSYIPMNVTSRLVQSVRFAHPSVPFGSTQKLILSLRDFLSKYSHLQLEVADLLVAFAFATWFCDCMPMAPVLRVFGPENAVSQVLRLLGCVCRRPVLLGDVDFDGLAALPERLGATLLLNQRDLGRRVKRALLGSNRRHFCILRGNGGLDLYGARAFSCESSQPAEHGLTVSLSPAGTPRSFLTDAEEQAVAQHFQSRLLRYRMVHYERVRRSRIDCKEFVPEMQDQVGTWLAPISECAQLTHSVFDEMLRQSQELAGARFLDPRCVVAEVALSFCHKPDTTHFFVGELAEKVNALLTGRHEESQLSAKGVGLVLRELGVYGERVAQGFRVTLTDVVRQRLHRLAFDYRVLSVEDGLRRCRFCPGGRATSKRIQ